VPPRISLCSVCHSQMPAGQSHCKNCGSMLCPHCRELLPQRSRYCPKCGFLSIAEEQSPIRKSAPSAISARPQAIPIPRVPVPTPPPVAQAAVHQQSFGTSVVQHQRNCPKCGASIDHELGRCSGCGLLYGVKHRVMQSPTAPVTPAPRPTTSWPQSSMGQQSPGAQAMGHQYNNPRPSLPTPSFGRPNYLSPGVAPQGGILMPIPSVAPATVGAAPASVPMAPRSYR
jgi:RNA polymerase subunit RPABC4/transcription elongation factor Spt4